MTISGFDEITTDSPEKTLLESLPTHAGRNNQGRITTRHQGGGYRKLYRKIDFKRDKHGVPGKVATIEYDPNRSARIALIHYKDGEKRYILAPVGLKVGDPIEAGPEVARERQDREATPRRLGASPRWAIERGSQARPRASSSSAAGKRKDVRNSRCHAPLRRARSSAPRSATRS